MIRLHVNDFSLMLIHFSREFDVDVDVNVILRETKKSYATHVTNYRKKGPSYFASSTARYSQLNLTAFQRF